MKQFYLFASLMSVLLSLLLGYGFLSVRKRFTLIAHGRRLRRRVPVVFSIMDVRNGALWISPRGSIYARVDGTPFAVEQHGECWHVSKNEQGEPILQGL